jgi:hypothetical protein
LFAVVDHFFFFFYISCISFWLFALWSSQYTLDDYQKKNNNNFFLGNIEYIYQRVSNPILKK